MHRSRSGALVALALLAGAAAAPAAEAPPQRPELRVAYAGAAGSPIHAGLLHFKEVLEQTHGGRVEVQLVPGAAGGDGAAILAGLRQGAVHVAVPGGEAALGPAARITDIPFLFRDAEHRRRVLEGAAGRLLARRIAEQSSLAVLGFFAAPDQVMAAAARPIARPADLRGMAFRVSVQPLVLEGLRSLGALPLPLPAPLTLAAARQRMVAGGQVDLPTALALQLYEVFPYMSQPATPFLAEVYPVLADRRALAALPPDLQRALAEAMQAAARRQLELAEEATAQAARDLQSRGARFGALDELAFQEAVRPFRETAGHRLKVEDLLAEIGRTR
jgi:TRAP-type C4-dicarboxylate transport system substrate-binding protein